MRKGWHWGLPLLAWLSLSGCGFTRPERLQLIEAPALQRLLQSQDILLVDVHVPEQEHIPGTDQFIPFYRIGSNLDKFPADKSAPIYLYCKSGPMANWAARTLLDAGYSNLYNLQGGMDAWRRQIKAD